jgi:hypothetical protein
MNTHIRRQKIVDELPVSLMTVDEMSVDKITDEVSIGELFVDRMTKWKLKKQSK